MYRLTRHVYDLTRKYYLLGRDRLIHRLDVPAGGVVLEIGCGTGRNLIRAAQGPSRRSVLRRRHLRGDAEDGAGEDRGGGPRRPHHRRPGATPTSFDAVATFGWATFDRVFFSYTLSMIPDWRGALAHAGGLCGAGDRLLVVDFGACAGLPGVLRRALWAWLAAFDVTPRLELEDMLALAAREEGRRLEVERPWGGLRPVLRDGLRRSHTKFGRIHPNFVFRSSKSPSEQGLSTRLDPASRSDPPDPVSRREARQERDVVERQAGVHQRPQAEADEDRDQRRPAGLEQQRGVLRRGFGRAGG